MLCESVHWVVCPRQYVIRNMIRNKVVKTEPDWPVEPGTEPLSGPDDLKTDGSHSQNRVNNRKTGQKPDKTGKPPVQTVL